MWPVCIYKPEIEAKSKTFLPIQRAVNNIYTQSHTIFIHWWNSIALKCMKNRKLSVICDKWIYVYVYLKCKKTSCFSGLEFLPVLIPSKRDSTLKPDFGLFGDGGRSDVASFFEKRAETLMNSNECIHIVWQMEWNVKYGNYFNTIIIHVKYAMCRRSLNGLSICRSG